MPAAIDDEVLFIADKSGNVNHFRGSAGSALLLGFADGRQFLYSRSRYTAGRYLSTTAFIGIAANASWAGVACAATSALAKAATPAPKPLPARPALKQVFIEDFSTFKATDTGPDASGNPCWRSRPMHGRTQVGNGELGFYADPVLNPGTTSWGKEASGRFFLQAESFPSGVANAAGGVEPFTYSASMITSDKISPVHKGDYFEMRCTMAQAIGSWPAFWIAPNDGSWPSMSALLQVYHFRYSKLCS